MPTMLNGFDWHYCCNCVMIKHNSQELQDKLTALGYYGLRWTICTEKEQKLIANGLPYRKSTGFGPNNYVDYDGAFWNAGIRPVRNPDDIGPRGNTIYVGDDEEQFLYWAERLIKEKEIYFDKEGKEIKQ